MVDAQDNDETCDKPGLKVMFNPFAFDIDTNNEFLAKGYEPIPFRIPSDD